MTNWSKTHSALILALLGVLFLHIKGEPSWDAVLTTASIGELGGQILLTLGAMLVGSPMSRKVWSPEERAEGQK